MKNLLLFSLIGSIIGLLIIIFLADNLEPGRRNISEIDERNLDEIVKVQGNMTNIREFESLTLFTIDDGSGKIDVVFYDKVSFEEERIVQVLGRVIEYKGKIEIEANKLKILE
jgi:RecJ-like exonuclease